MLDNETNLITQQTLADLAADRLSRAITGGNLAPGERLVERELSERFGISRAPIREALLALDRQGLTVSVPRRGTFVRTWTKQDLWEVAILRATLEALAGKLAVSCMSDEDLEALQGLADKMKHAASVDDDRLLVDLDFYFQIRMLDCCPHQRLKQLLLDMRLQVRVFRAAILDKAHAVYPAAYAAIMAALRTRDPEVVHRTIYQELMAAAEAALAEMSDGQVDFVLPPGSRFGERDVDAGDGAMGLSMYLGARSRQEPAGGWRGATGR